MKNAELAQYLNCLFVIIVSNYPKTNEYMKKQLLLCITIILLTGSLFTTGCTKVHDPVECEECEECGKCRECEECEECEECKDTKTKLTSFSFKKEHNPELEEDVLCDIQGNNITILIPSLTNAQDLIPSFEGNYYKVTVDDGEEEQFSGVTAQNFTKTLNYNVQDENGLAVTYHVTVHVFSALPIVRLNIDNGEDITEKEVWKYGKVSISDVPGFAEGYEGPMRARGRGNATWGYKKKPYRFKLDTKSEILGMPSDKDWVLLAEYCDKSMMRNVYGFELGRLMGLPWSPRYQHVELFLNDEYVGTYLLTEHVKRADERVNISKNGYLLESFGGFWWEEDVFFVTEKSNTGYTFKYPDSDDLSMEHADVLWIKDYMNTFEDVLYGDDFADPESGYRAYIDVENFADWYLVNEVLANFDTNNYYSMNDRSSKIQMFPIWDLEWCLGLAEIKDNGYVLPPGKADMERLCFKNSEFYYFERLFEDPYFVEVTKQRWQIMKAQIPLLLSRVDQVAEGIKYAPAKNFERWDTLNRLVSVGLYYMGNWNSEVEMTKTMLNQRVEWFDREIATW